MVNVAVIVNVEIPKVKVHHGLFLWLRCFGLFIQREQQLVVHIELSERRRSESGLGSLQPHAEKRKGGRLLGEKFETPGLAREEVSELGH